ncbi:MAG: acylphosphatase [Candidatus Yanofskybacteria bacterium CG10_big_fil_rev_8_21_14_0_10_36_16]|uniref:acylphosphatase n=1 Tax=Candidatus Yanofskybacteria bacterium CG10_big_fil_rev_8_21_14_0_10_36_16 TaxID=1975096 RepID=A0A2J0Q6J8_9BACT|nr:MAG: acylphosphatase [Candidatus Yanofskybacteria bacterium CG10_big_fil_rev_8_21_14_0_10_36_16]
MIKHLKISITGKVQTVGFRYSAKQKADELGINGFASNEQDGSVHIEVEGTLEKIEEFIKWCQQGPTNAKVENLTSEEGKIKNYQGFEIQ